MKYWVDYKVSAVRKYNLFLNKLNFRRFSWFFFSVLHLYTTTSLFFINVSWLVARLNWISLSIFFFHFFYFISSSVFFLVADAWQLWHLKFWFNVWVCWSMCLRWVLCDRHKNALISQRNSLLQKEKIKTRISKHKKRQEKSYGNAIRPMVVVDWARHLALIKFQLVALFLPKDNKLNFRIFLLFHFIPSLLLSRSLALFFSVFAACGSRFFIRLPFFVFSQHSFVWLGTWYVFFFPFLNCFVWRKMCFFFSFCAWFNALSQF